MFLQTERIRVHAETRFEYECLRNIPILQVAHDQGTLRTDQHDRTEEERSVSRRLVSGHGIYETLFDGRGMDQR